MNWMTLHKICVQLPPPISLVGGMCVLGYLEILTVVDDHDSFGVECISSLIFKD